jgi:hypothetical protein
MKNITILFLVLLLPFLSYPQSALYKIKNLNLDKNNGSIISYYSKGFAVRANELSSMLQKSVPYFKDSLEVEEDYSLAVLDFDDLQKVSRVPYGLPSVSGPPYVVIFPATSNHTLAEVIGNAINGHGLEAKYSSSKEELVNKFISFIGFHEIGHIYAKKKGLKFPNKWTFEFAATYLAYMFIDEYFPKESEIWMNISEILINELRPVYTHLEDFEKLYVQVGIENYAWYQVVFLARAKEIAEKSGFNFINKYQNAKITESDFALNDLEKLNSGFLKWSAQYKFYK